MDVVFNYVYERENLFFEKIVSGYFFWYDEFGMLLNGIGVGNDIVLERWMVRKFIVDCVIYWIEEYDVDGFCFDLFGILDIDIVFYMKEKVIVVKSGILFFGEGWDLVIFLL